MERNKTVFNIHKIFQFVRIYVWMFFSFLWRTLERRNLFFSLSMRHFSVDCHSLSKRTLKNCLTCWNFPSSFIYKIFSNFNSLLIFNFLLEKQNTHKKTKQSAHSQEKMFIYWQFLIEKPQKPIAIVIYTIYLSFLPMNWSMGIVCKRKWIFINLDCNKLM